MKVEFTKRGFARIDFIDRYNAKCSIQDSSIATEDCIWLGCNEGEHADGSCCARMHLTQEHVRQLLPVLQRFLDTGTIMERNDE